MRAAGCCINDVADRNFDRHVERTARRPVTTGAVSVREALMLGAALALVAFGLVLTVHRAAAAWSVVALVIAIAYPYSKRLVSMPQAVLGVAFSFGIPMAFAAVTGGVPALAWALLATNLFWVLAYDTEYAMVDRDDDLKIGIKTSALTLGRYDVIGVMSFYATYLAASALIGAVIGLAWPFFVGLAAAAVQAAWHGRLIRHRDRAACFRAFRVNHWLGFTMFAGTALALAAA
jgi:4-hydroxybenzoate polyprenyltransferase